jgi:AcrR family transcriptional regulator
MRDRIEERFIGKAATPKGRRALQAIFRSTWDTVVEVGLEGASLEAIAGRAGLSQAALRHYFATRDDLMFAFFVGAMDWLQDEVTELLAKEGMAPREKLESCIGWHLEFMEHVDTVFWLEASAYSVRRGAARKSRDAFYRWLAGQYALLVGQIQPLSGARERERRAFVMLTLVVGAWITHGRGSRVDPGDGVRERRQLLVDAAMDIATR